MNNTLLSRYQQVLNRIETARKDSGRHDPVTLLAVSKPNRWPTLKLWLRPDKQPLVKIMCRKPWKKSLSDPI